MEKTKAVAILNIKYLTKQNKNTLIISFNKKLQTISDGSAPHRMRKNKNERVYIATSLIEKLL